MSAANEMQAVFDRYVALYTAGDAAAIATLFTPDGRVYSPFGPPAIGRRAVEEIHEAWIAEGETNKSMRVVAAEIDGALGYCVAQYSGEFRAESGAMVTEAGTSVNVLRRAPDGAWRIAVSSLNGDVTED